MAEAVLYENDGPVTWITINRPEARNALNQPVRQGLWDGLRRFAADDASAVLVLTGAGDEVFCAGADLKEMAELKLEVPPPDYAPYLNRNIDMPKPVIAAVNGAALAGGFLLAQMCDLCVAAEHARFAITEARWGRGAPWAAPLPWLIPPRVALELLMTAEPIDARRAQEIGLVNRVVPAAELLSEAKRLAASLATKPALSVRYILEAVHKGVEMPLAQAQVYEATLFGLVFSSDDMREGTRAFLEKRKPEFKGR